MRTAHPAVQPGEPQALELQARTLWSLRQPERCTGTATVLEVTVRGRPDPATGYVLDLGELKRILERAVTGPCDHRHLNRDVAFLRGIHSDDGEPGGGLPGRACAPRIPAGELHSVRLFETPRNFAEYRGGGVAP